MFFRKITTRKNGKEYVYVKLIENYRTNGKMKQRVVANFGSMENLSADRINDLIISLKKLYQEVGAQEDKKLNIAPIKTKIPGIKDLLLNSQTFQSICNDLPEDQQKVLLSIMIKRILAADIKEPIQGVCSQLDLMDGSSIQFYNTMKKLGEAHTCGQLLKNTWGCNEKQQKETIYIHIINSLFQGVTFDADITGNVYAPQNYCKKFRLLLACDQTSTPLDFYLVEEKSDLYKAINSLSNRLANYKPVDVIILDGNKELNPAASEFIVAQPIENKRLEEGCYFNTTQFEQKSEEKVKEIKANLAKVAAGLENIKADILLGKLNKESAIRKRAEAVIRGNNCQDLVTYHFNESEQNLTYHIQEEVLKEKTYSIIQTCWFIPSAKIKKKDSGSIDIKTESFHTLTDQLNIPPINMYGDYHYSPDIISGHIILEIIIKQLAVVAKLPQQGGEAHITH